MTEHKAHTEKENNDQLNVSMARLTFPAYGTAVLTVSHGLIDSFFLSKISYTAAAAVGGIFSFLAMCGFLLRNFAQAGGIVANQHIGARQSESVAKAFSVCLTMGVILGGVLASIIYGLSDRIPLWMGFSDELSQMSTEYMRLACFHIFLQSISFSYMVFISIHGFTSWNFTLIVTMNVLNIAGNFILLQWNGGEYFSVSSVVMASIFASIIPILMEFYFVHSKMGIRLIPWVGKNTFRDLARQISKIGIPSSLFPVSLQLNLLALVVFINQLGPEMLSTQVYSINIIMLTVAWTTAVAQSSQIYISRLVGSSGFDQAEQKLKQTLTWGITGALLITSCFCVFSDELFGLMTTNAVILQQGAIILMMGLILEPLRALNMITLASLNAAGDAKYPGLLSIVMMWVIGVPMSWIFGIHLAYGLVGIYIGRIIDESLRALMVYLRWRSRLWQTKGITFDPHMQLATKGN